MWDCCFCAIGWSKVGNSGCLSSPSCVKTVYGRQNGQEWYSQYDCYFLLPFLNRNFPNHDHCGQSWSSSYKNSYPCLILTYRRPRPSIFFTTAKLYSVHGPCSIGEIFFCLTFTNSKSFDPINGNLFERDSLILLQIALLPLHCHFHLMIVFHLLLLSPTSCSLACPLQTSKWQTPQPFCLPCPWFAAVSWARTWPMLILASSDMAVISFFENDLAFLKLQCFG